MGSGQRPGLPASSKLTWAHVERLLEEEMRAVADGNWEEARACAIERYGAEEALAWRAKARRGQGPSPAPNTGKGQG